MQAVSFRFCVFLSAFVLSVFLSGAASLAEDAIAAEFKACDADGDGVLTEAEYLKRVGRERAVLLREFKVFDLDRDGKMTQAEFVTVPVGQAEELRGKLADPVVALSERERWLGWRRSGRLGIRMETTRCRRRSSKRRTWRLRSVGWQRRGLLIGT